MQLGTSTSIFDDPLDLDVIFSVLEQTGFDVFELFCRPGHFDPTDRTVVQKLQRKLAHSTVKVWSLHAPFSRELDISSGDEEVRSRAMDWNRTTIRLAHELGAPVVVVHPSSEPITDEERPNRLVQAKASLRELALLVSQVNVQLAVELLPRSCLGHSAVELGGILDGLPDHVGICLDANHPPDAALLPDYIRFFGPRLLTLHLSDFDNVDERHWLPGEGVVDWLAVWVTLEEVGYQGPWMYEVKSKHKDHLADAAMLAGNFTAWKGSTA